MTGSTPALSVVMPAFNAEDYVGRAIESILEQTLDDLELIVVDDQSTDGTWRIVQEYAARDDRVRIDQNRHNLGPAGSINRAVGLARAAIIAGMDADDISVPHRMERQMALLRSDPSIAVVGSYVSHINDDDEILSLSRTGPVSIAEFETLRSRGEPTMVFGGTAMYHRRDYEAVGGLDASLRAAADIEFCDRMADRGAVVAIPEPLLLYRVYSTSNVMLRFREGRQTHRFLEARRKARCEGAPLPTREAFAAMEEKLSWWKRLNIWRDDFAQFNYRRAGLAYGEGRITMTALCLAASAIADPIHVVGRVWDQRLSSEARKIRAGRDY